jgi:hypothetical protein
MAERADPAVALLRGGWAAARRAVEALPARAAYEEATDLADQARAIAAEAAAVRAAAAARIRDEGRLTVRELAAELDLAPSQAARILDRARDVSRETAAGVSRETRDRPTP